MLDSILAQNLMASKAYLERAWALAERMARFGRRERMCQWMSLESWVGMVLDAVIKGRCNRCLDGWYG